MLDKEYYDLQDIYHLINIGYLFCNTADGAITTGKLFSIVQTARANGLKSEQYLTYVISNINIKDINDLLLWSIYHYLKIY